MLVHSARNWVFSSGTRQQTSGGKIRGPRKTFPGLKLALDECILFTNSGHGVRAHLQPERRRFCLNQVSIARARRFGSPGCLPLYAFAVARTRPAISA